MAKLKYEDVKKFIESDKDYKLLDNTYINTKTKMNILHLKCNKPFLMTYDHFKRGQRCSNCSCTKKSTTSEFKKKVKKIYGYDYTVLGKYVNNRTKILMKHNDCGTEWKVRPDNFLNGYGCPECGGSKQLTTEQFKKKIFDKYNNDYIILGEYINNKTNILVKHKCGHEYPVRPGNILYNGTECPECSKNSKMSKGEKRIYDYLTENNIQFEREFKFEDCKHINQLRFDFKVFYNDKFFLVEYDGLQHFRPTGRFTKEYVEELQKRDQIKNKYCQDNNLHLLRISYKDYKNISTVLEKYIQTFNDYYVDSK